jgi:hypothetical protein
MLACHPQSPFKAFCPPTIFEKCSYVHPLSGFGVPYCKKEYLFKLFSI